MSRAYGRTGRWPTPLRSTPPPGSASEFVDYYSLDIGYSFIVELGRLAFPTLPDNHLRALALQLTIDFGMPLLLCFLFAQWRAGLGLAAAFLYTGNKVFIQLVSDPLLLLLGRAHRVRRPRSAARVTASDRGRPVGFSPRPGSSSASQCG